MGSIRRLKKMQSFENPKAEFNSTGVIMKGFLKEEALEE